MLVRHFKNHSPTPQKYVHRKLPTFANGVSTQIVSLEIVGERAQTLPTVAHVRQQFQVERVVRRHHWRTLATLGEHTSEVLASGF